MEQQSSWENWPLLHTEMGHDDDDCADFLEQCHTTDDEDFLRDILLQQPDFSSETSDTQSFHHPNSPPPPPSPSLPIVHNSNNNSTALAATCDEARKKPTTRPSSSSSSPRTFILSFDNSTIIPATPEQQPYLLAYPQLGGTTMRSSKSTSSPAFSSNKRPLLDTNTTANNDHHNLETKPSASNQGGNKKSRNDSQTMDHIMAERKRRQELTERFIALSATIPGLKKTDKASILREAINYVKQLQERVTELEKRNKRGPESMIFLKKTDIGGNNEDITSSETSSDQDCCESLPDVEARVVEKEVLIEIHCEKATGIELKILDQLENLHLSVTGSSVLPFGNSTLGITIIAQMGEAYRMTVNDLVTNLREVLLKHVSY